MNTSLYIFLYWTLITRLMANMYAFWQKLIFTWCCDWDCSVINAKSTIALNWWSRRPSWTTTRTRLPSRSGGGSSTWSRRWRETASYEAAVSKLPPSPIGVNGVIDSVSASLRKKRWKKRRHENKIREVKNSIHFVLIIWFFKLSWWM